MSKILLGNILTAELVGAGTRYPSDGLEGIGVCSQRVLWGANDHDIVVLPIAPTREFAEYVTDLTQTDLQSLAFVETPVGYPGRGTVSAECVRNRRFLSQFGELAAEHHVTKITPYYFDQVATAIARAAGVMETTPGFGFADEGGVRMLNSKAHFRAIARAAGVPIADGVVTTDPDHAADYAAQEIAAGRAVIVKQDHQCGGNGNEVLHPLPDAEAIGALTAVCLGSRHEVLWHVAGSWPRYSDGGRERVIVESYIPGCLPVYLELQVDDEGIREFGRGEMLMSPTNDGIAVPGGLANVSGYQAFRTDALRLAETVRSLGYRGFMSVDGMATAAGRVLVNEINVRDGGSTHVHHLAERVLGAAQGGKHMVTKVRHTDHDFSDTLKRIEGGGFGFDLAAKTGVVLTMAVTPSQKFEYTAIGDSAAEAADFATALDEEFPSA
ncbi:peptide ligase PGM1-related protein [Amycolatopsis sp. cmx-11-12]|uniref:preATP grasp domain-containing protein n=1 Tax=Amycolatopsis sp. cmx-11-12 TaxID=2785795 RepID=UPI003917E3F2